MFQVLVIPSCSFCPVFLPAPRFDLMRIVISQDAPVARPVQSKGITDPMGDVFVFPGSAYLELDPVFPVRVNEVSFTIQKRRVSRPS